MARKKTDSSCFPGNLGALLDHASDRSGLSTGIADARDALTYRQYLEAVCRMVYGLKKLGLGPERRVVLMAPNSVSYPLVSLAIFRAGAILVPVNPKMKRFELAHILSETRPELLICERGNLPVALQAIGLCDGLPPPRLITLDEKAPSTDFLKDLNLSQADRTCETVRPEQTAMIVYTAAVDGYALGAELPHSAVVQDALAFAARAFPDGPDDGDSVAALLPLFHTYGFTSGFLFPLAGGVPCLLMDTSLRGRSAAALMEAHKTTHVISVPALYLALLKPISEAPGLRSRLRNLTSGGVALSKALFEAYAEKTGLPIREGYGLTEASPVVTWNGVERPPRSGSVGYPLDCCRIKVVDGAGREVPPGQEGEVLVKGANLFSGYLHHPDKTEQALSEGWLRTGDLGFVDRDQYLTLTGLKKDMINVYGLKVYPKEVERILLYHPGIQSAVVRPEQHPKYGEVVACQITVKPGQALSAAECLRWCRENLSPYKIPRSFNIIEGRSAHRMDARALGAEDAT